MHSTHNKRTEKTGAIRIIAGEYRGRRIKVAERPGLRPTPDRVRETLFNWLGQWLDGLTCLDLFAGSGALGFEAASRGAKQVVMVESDRASYLELVRTKELLRAASVQPILGDALEFLERSGRFDVVFLDPPFRQNALPAVLRKLEARLASGARVYVESAEPVALDAPWIERKSSRAGQVSYQLFEWSGDDSGGLSGNV